MSKIVIDGRMLRLSTGRYVRKFLHYMEQIDKKNHYVVLINKADEGAWQPSAENFELRVVPYKHYGFGEQIGFAWYLYREKADLVHFTMPQQPLLYFRKHVSTIHDLTLINFKNVKNSATIFNFKQLVFKIFVKIIARTSAHILTLTNYSKKSIAKYTRINPAKITATPLAADPINEAAQTVDQLSGKRFIMYVGTAHVHKNLSKLLDAYQLIESKDVHLVFVGNKTVHYENLEQEARDKRVKNIHFLGFLSDAKLRWLYEHTTAYVFPSLSEGFGLPPLEAMQYDVPVASSNASCLPEVYGDSVLYFDPDSADDMADKINQLLDDTALQQKLIKKGQALVKKYSWEDTAKQIHKVYIETLK